MKAILAIDPGQNGAIVAADPERAIFHARKMPETEGDVLEMARYATKAAIAKGWEMVAVIESQTGCAGIRQSAPASFKFGRGYGFILGVLQTLGWRIELVTPQKWQKELGLGHRDKTAPKSDWKNKLKATAQRLFPDMEVTLSTADALLLLEYYRRTHDMAIEPENKEA